MLDQLRHRQDSEDDFVEFVLTGMPATGEYHCADCGYGVTVQHTLPQCPMCSGTAWEPHAWSPFTRARSHA